MYPIIHQIGTLTKRKMKIKQEIVEDSARNARLQTYLNRWGETPEQTVYISRSRMRGRGRVWVASFESRGIFVFILLN